VKERDEGGKNMRGVLSAVVQLVIGIVAGYVMFLILMPLI
jgi:hypothetical protein